MAQEAQVDDSPAYLAMTIDQLRLAGRTRRRSSDWVKVKNRQHPAFARVKDSFR
jgi:hypothetical protein